jgi:hypothetical protein
VDRLGGLEKYVRISKIFPEKILRPQISFDLRQKCVPVMSLRRASGHIFSAAIR